MKTNEARTAAHNAADALDWAAAASFMRTAIANYPMMPGRSTHGGIALLDLSKMEKAAAGYEAMQ